jgi:capsular exopolysaccharide synthesis family protein
MAAASQLGVYLAVLRKHVVLLTVSAALVVAAGVLYVMRQEPVFLSTATLLVETPAKSVAGGGEYADALARQEDELQTQVLLLKQSPELAAKAIATLKSDGVDAAAGDYTERTLPRRVKIESVPGTRCVNFSLTGPDPQSLPQAVNAYAQVFQEWVEERGAKRTDLQEEELQARVTDAQKVVDDAQKVQDALVQSHPEVNLASGENAADRQLRALLEVMARLETDHARDTSDRTAIDVALSNARVVARRQGDAFVLERADAEEPSLAERLFANEHVTALPCIRTNSAISDRLRSEREAVERDRELREQGLRENQRERIQARDEAKSVRADCGARIAGVVADELARIAAATHIFETKKLDAERFEKEAVAANLLLQQYKSSQSAIEAAKKKLELAADRLKGFQQSVSHNTDESGRASRAMRRIVMATPARAPAAQIAPNVPLVIGLTAFAAVAVGVLLVLLFEYLDDTVKSKEDFERYVGLPFLGFIPRIEGREAENPDIAATGRSGTVIAEAFRAVRTSILFSRSGKPVRSMLVTSAGPGEGKTTVATNLAITLAKHKGPVLLVDADLRRPRIAKALGLDNRIGLTNYLIGEATLEEVVQSTSVEGLYAITSGPVPPNPAELLHGERLATLLTSGLERFDRIVIDSPPLIAVSDARVIARCADGLYVVISMGRTSWRLIQRSLESLTSIGCTVHGAILNNLTAPTGRYGYYYYRDYAYEKGYYAQQQPAPAAETH